MVSPDIAAHNGRLEQAQRLLSDAALIAMEEALSAFDRQTIHQASVLLDRIISSQRLALGDARRIDG